MSRKWFAYNHTLDGVDGDGAVEVEEGDGSASEGWEKLTMRD